MKILVQCEPIYDEFSGWGDFEIDTAKKSATNGFEIFPKQVQEYLNYIETSTKLPIDIVSVGPERNETIRITH